MKKMIKKSRDPEAENDQNKKRISTAPTFWTIKRTTKPATTTVKMSLVFIGV